MTAYLTPETKEALRKALHDKARTGIFRSDYAVSLSTALEIIDSLPVVGAVPAEEALAKLGFLADLAVANKLGDYNVGELDAAVRHALRAAQAQADADGCCTSCGHPLTGAEAGRTVSRSAAPPPPDVIRRGHEAWSALEAEFAPSDRLIGDMTMGQIRALMPAIRAAMHKRPKEE